MLCIILQNIGNLNIIAVNFRPATIPNLFLEVKYHFCGCKPAIIFEKRLCACYMWGYNSMVPILISFLYLHKNY